MRARASNGSTTLQGKGLQRGLIYFFFSGMTSSVLGVMLAVLGFIFMWGLAMMIVKALFAYLAGYIGIAFMMIIAPLFIPLALFRTTKEYFDKWAKLVISFTLQPPLILLFVSFSIAATDLALFSGDYSVMYRIAGEASRKPGFNLNKYLEENQAVRQTPAVFGYAKTNADEVIETVESTGNSVLSNRTSACTRALIQNGDGSHPECSDVMPIQAFRNAIDWAKLAEVRDPPVLLSPGTERKEQQISREVMAALIFLGVVVFLMNRLMGVIPYILVDLVGEAKQTPNLLNDTTNQWSRGADQMSSSAGASMKGALTGLVTQRRGGAE